MTQCNQFTLGGTQSKKKKKGETEEKGSSFNQESAIVPLITPSEAPQLI